jgi:protein PhnA
MTIEQKLMQRCDSKCELCSAATHLNTYAIPPDSDASAEKSIMLCDTCLAQIDQRGNMDAKHWRCLNDSMWSQVPAVQVMAWRQLKQLSDKGETWAQDLLDMLYLDDSVLDWAKATQPAAADPHHQPTLDCNGATLQAGDTVTLIKDLDVKGANFTAKRGTAVRGISLTDNPEHIEGRVNGTRIVILTCFVKKS